MYLTLGWLDWIHPVKIKLERDFEREHVYDFC